MSALVYRDLVLERLPPGWTIDSTGRLDRVYTLYVAEGGQHELEVDGDLLYFHRNLHDVLRWFEADVRIFVAERRQDLLFVHAGVVGWRGHANHPPRARFERQNDACKRFLRRRATYYSDTFAVFDGQGRVHSYSAPMDSEPLPASLIVATMFVRGAEWEPKRLSPDCALLVLFANAVAIHPLPGSALKTLRKVVSGTIALEGPRGEAEEIVDSILRELPAPERKQQRAAAQMASSSSSSSCFW